MVIAYIFVCLNLSAVLVMKINYIYTIGHLNNQMLGECSS